jgi:hypothetical protein
MAGRGRKRGPSKAAVTAGKVARATLKKILVLRSKELVEELDKINNDDTISPDKKGEKKVSAVVGRVKDIFEDMLGLQETPYNEFGVDIFEKATLSAIGIQVEPDFDDDDDDDD